MKREPNKAKKTNHVCDEVDSIDSIYHDFIRENRVELVAPEFKVIGVSLKQDIHDVGAPTDYGYRKLFSMNEGNYLSIRLQTNVDMEQIESLWTRHHEVKVQFLNGYRLKCDEYKLVGGQDHDFYVLVNMDWYLLEMDEVTRGRVYITLGHEATLVTYSEVYICPPRLKVKGKKGVLTLMDHLLPGKELHLATASSAQKRKLPVCYKCNIDLENFPGFEDGPEMEFRFYDEQMQFYHTAVVKGFYDFDSHKTIYYHPTHISCWPDGVYTVEVYLMGSSLKSTQFTLENGQVASVSRARHPKKSAKPSIPAMDKLNNMVGLSEVKQFIRLNTDFMRFMNLRHQEGMPTTGRLMNLIFSGNPGTGKTTVARLIGEILAESGILSKGHLVECNREMLIDNYVGGTEKNTGKYLKDSKGGVLFIDEGYSLNNNNPHNTDFGQRVIDTLMPVLSEENSDRIVILAGYEKEMEELLRMNPGLKSRFPLHLHFPDYTVNELMEITRRYLVSNDYTCTPHAEALMREVYEQASVIQNFGSGRFIHTFLQNMVLPAMATRVLRNPSSVPVSKDMLRTIQPEDIPLPEKALIQMGLKHPEQGKVRIGFR